ncbi:SdpI/YhfL family protein OS=Ureibacillus acetophenoni OX=614649 GN=SAMN05877842_11093 PE=4 SV=1 [Ureibacillus acetophenoni]
MEYIAEIIVISILLIPVYGLLLWAYFEPRDAFLFGNRWMYKEDPEPSQKWIRYTKFTSLWGMIVIPTILINFIPGIPLLLRFTPVVVIFIMIMGILKILVAEEN